MFKKIARLLCVTTIGIVYKALPIAGFYIAFAAQAEDGSVGVSVTEPMAEPYQAKKDFKPNLARITFYRPQQGYMVGVASIEVNGRYHSALQLASYSELCLPAGRIAIAARMTQIGSDPKGFHDATTTLNLQEGQSAYLRLVDFGDGRATITPVRAEIALTELRDTRRQAHVQSRVLGAQDCVEAPKEAVLQKENVVLIADGLFDFGHAEIKTSNSSSRKSLDDVIAHIQKNFGSSKDVVISITGHSDPMGDATLNQRLSEARAKSIRVYMIKRGIAAEQIFSEGKGSEQLVVTGCGMESTQANIECNKLNRRVVVNIQAAKR
jgi:OOP family OmpA-OmpF porin